MSEKERAAWEDAIQAAMDAIAPAWARDARTCHRLMRHAIAAVIRAKALSPQTDGVVS